MMTFQAWRLDRGSVDIDVPQSPVGRIQLFSFGPRALVLPERGSAVVLPVCPSSITWPHTEVLLGAGGYAVVPGGARVAGGGLVIYTPEYSGLSQAGGPCEGSGRLKYIDGCSDTLLVCPPVLGEPCLNLLHLPPGTRQTEHTHPSDRIGIILRGNGVCRAAGDDVPLSPRMFWYIPAGLAHSFHTDALSLDVLAWHPDSDFGPTRDAHPMVNRTIVEGVSVNDPRHEGLRTQ